MNGATVTFDMRSKCRLSPDWAADEIERVRRERDALVAKLNAIRDGYRAWANEEWADEAADRRFAAVLRTEL